MLRAEITAFARLFGPYQKRGAPWDSRIPEVHNAELLKGRGLPRYGIAFDGNEAMRGHELGSLADRPHGAEGGWREGIDPAELARTGIADPLGHHPNNWASGPGLWLDRMLGAALPGGLSATERRRRPIRTGTDQPPQ